MVEITSATLPYGTDPRDVKASERSKNVEIVTLTSERVRSFHQKVERHRIRKVAAGADHRVRPLAMRKPQNDLSASLRALNLWGPTGLWRRDYEPR